MRALADRLEFDSLPWLNYARCVIDDVPVDIFFGESSSAVAAAKRICATCPAQTACLNYALDANIQHGVWGGRSVRERRPLRKARLAAKRAAA